MSYNILTTGVSLCPGINIWAYSLTTLPFSGMNSQPEFSNCISFCALCIIKLNYPACSFPAITHVSCCSWCQ